MYESYYQPTDADLHDWHHHCLAMAAEELDEREGYEPEPSDEQLQDWREEEDYRNEGCDDVDNDADESMDGDHESALESVYGPSDFE